MPDLHEAAAEKALLDDLKEQLTVARRKVRQAVYRRDRKAWLVCVTTLCHRIRALDPEWMEGR